MSELKSLQKAVELAGGQSALARKCTPHAPREITQQDVWSWLYRSEKVSGDCAIPVELAVDGQVSRHDLRPDIFGPSPKPARKVANAS